MLLDQQGVLTEAEFDQVPYRLTKYIGGNVTVGFPRG